MCKYNRWQRVFGTGPRPPCARGDDTIKSRKRRFGDRKDGTLIRDIDSIHYFSPYLYPNRADNEACISENIDLGPINAYLESRNAADPQYPYTLFHIVLSALLKTVYLRPKLNRFIQNKRIYLRNEVTAAFVVKKSFSDDGEEALAFIRCRGDSTVTSLHDEIMEQITFCRSDRLDNSTASMDMLRKLPRPIFGALMWALHKLDKHGWVPLSLIKTDPYYASVVISNLGSIGLKCGYHHLCNWGTNSLFCVMGKTCEKPVLFPDGSVSLRPTLELSLTIDERLADGYYYSKSMRLLKHLLANPQLLELPAEEKPEY